MNEIELLKNKLKSHDWYYHRSDDYTAFTRGMAAESNLRALISKCMRQDPVATRKAVREFYMINTTVLHDNPEAKSRFAFLQQYI